MEIINNINKTLKEDLKAEIKEGSKLSIAAACFSIYAFQELRVAIFKQVNQYPLYKLVKCADINNISLDEFDEKVLNAHNEALSRLNRKKRKYS